MRNNAYLVAAVLHRRDAFLEERTADGVVVPVDLRVACPHGLPRCIARKEREP